MKFKNFLFDWDGTLAMTLDIWLEAYKEVLKNRGLVNVTDRDITTKAFGKWQVGLENIGVVDSDKGIEELKSIVDLNIKNVLLYPNVISTLDFLKDNGAKLAILSSSPKELLTAALRKYNMEKYFDVIITRYDVVNGKPHREMVDKALSSIGGELIDSVIIGDSEGDILTGRNAGIKSILFYPEHNNLFYERQFLLDHKPDMVIDDLVKLKEYV